MKVAISCKYFAPRGGAQTFLFNFADSLIDSGHEVHVVAMEVEADCENIEVTLIEPPAVPKTFRDLAYARASRDALAGIDADVTFGEQKSWGAQVVRPGGGVHHEYMKQVVKSYALAPQRLLKRITKPYSPKERLNLYIEKKLYASEELRCVIANSRMVRRHLLKHYPELDDMVALVYNGVDCRRFTPELRDEWREPIRDELDIPQDALVGAFVAFDWRRKGLSTLIEALSLLQDMNPERPVYIIVVGKNKLLRTKMLCRWHGVLDRFRFVGPSDPAKYYAASDVLTLPTYFDPCANVTLEGLASGLPAITTVHNGAHELLTPGEDGYVMSDASAADELADFLEECANRDDLEVASRAARELAQAHTVEKMFGELEGILVDVAAGRNPGAGQDKDGT